MKHDCNGDGHRSDGTRAAAAEAAAYLAGKSTGVAAGLAIGTARGITIGVAMSAEALGWSLQGLWRLIRRRGGEQVSA